MTNASAAPASNSPRLAVVGGGLSGLSAALALAPFAERTNADLALIAPATASDDARTTALMMPSIRMLERMGVWQICDPSAAPLRTMRLVDGTKRLIRAPLTEFHATEIGESAFGYNASNADLLAAMEQRIEETPRISRHDAQVAAATSDSDTVMLELSNGETMVCDLVVAADGRNSIIRDAAGIDVRRWSYPQTAIVLTFTHTLPHGDVSTEFHTETGPFTQVPLPGHNGLRSSLVWVVRPEQAQGIIDLPVKDLSQEVEDRMQSVLGKVAVEEGLQAFPLSGLTAHQFAKGRIALVGEAGHVFPPIGAQGLNLGLRDVASLAEKLAECPHAADIPAALGRYDTSRRLDVTASTAAVDAMNRSLLTSFLPVQAGRAVALTALNTLPGMRQIAMKLGMGDRNSLFSRRGKDPAEVSPSR